MGAEIGGSRRRQHGNRAMPMERAEGGAWRTRKIPVIDEQRGARLPRKASTERRRQSKSGGTNLDDGTLLSAVTQALWNQQSHDRAWRSLDEDEAILTVQRHQSLRPVDAAAHELPNRQSVEELVGDEQHRAVGQILEARYPDRFRLREALLLHGAERGTRFDQMEAQRAIKIRHGCRGAQQIADQHAATGSELREDDGIGSAQLTPHHGAPQTDQLAKHLADLWSSDEVALRPDRVTPRIIAAVGVVQRHRHIGGDRKRTTGADAAGDLPAERVGDQDRAGTGARCAQRMMATPAINSGTDNS